MKWSLYLSLYLSICVISFESVPDPHESESHKAGHTNPVFQPKKPHADEQVWSGFVSACAMQDVVSKTQFLASPSFDNDPNFNIKEFRFPNFTVLLAVVYFHSIITCSCQRFNICNNRLITKITFLSRQKVSPPSSSRSRNSVVRPAVKPPPIPAYTQNLHSETRPSPSVPPKTRPGPPNRPPPPCPVTKPSRTPEVRVL